MLVLCVVVVGWDKKFSFRCIQITPPFNLLARSLARLSPTHHHKAGRLIYLIDFLYLWPPLSLLLSVSSAASWLRADDAYEANHISKLTTNETFWVRPSILKTILQNPSELKDVICRSVGRDAPASRRLCLIDIRSLYLTNKQRHRDTQNWMIYSQNKACLSFFDRLECSATTDIQSHYCCCCCDTFIVLLPHMMMMMKMWWRLAIKCCFLNK